MKLRDALGISVRRQRQLARGMQLILFGLIFVGMERQSPNIVLNAVLALGITFLPAILERDHEIPMDAGLTLWITAAAFLHAVGVIGIPGTEQSLYGTIPYYDHVTHALSSSVVAGVGYATVLGFDRHSAEISIPPKFMFVFIFVFVIAFGVVWEILEFSIAVLGSRTGVGSTGFTQHGLNDTMLDLVFDTIGGALVALWGTVYLTDVADAFRERLEARNPSKR